LIPLLFEPGTQPKTLVSSKRNISVLGYALIILLFSLSGFGNDTITAHAQDSTHINEDSLQTVTSADSASVITPAIGTAIDKNTIHYRISPKNPIDSVFLTVRHSNTIVETLAFHTTPPFEATWDCSTIPDQDQWHLQFGYILFHSNGKTIHTPPLPNRWVLDRTAEFSDQNYIVMETRDPESFEIDGNLTEWQRFSTAPIGSVGYFQLAWTSAQFFFGAFIRDTSLHINDLLELHIDIHQTRTSFAGINHRSIQFGPKTRSNTFAVSLNDSGFVLVDSITIRISREMEWRTKIVSEGYVVEASIPLTVLASIEFPPKHFGFDVSVIDASEDTSQPPRFTSWAGSKYTNRYNPSEWGTVTLTQTMFPLKLTLLILGGIILAIILFIIIKLIRQEQRDRIYDETENKPLSPDAFLLRSAIRDHVATIPLTKSTVANATGLSLETIDSLLKNEFNATFDRLIDRKSVV